MKISKLTLGVAAAALAAAPAIAQASFTPSIAPLSGDESELEGGTAILVGLGAAAAVIGAVILASSDDKKDLPISG